MKKILAICLAAVLLLAALPVSFAMADGEAKIIGTVDKATACPGQTVTLTMSIENNPGLVGWLVQVDYDESALEMTTQTAGTIFAGVAFGPKQSGKGVSWYDFINPDNTSNGVMYTLGFTVKADAAEGNYPITVSTNDPENMCNANWDVIPVIFESTSVTVGHTYDNGCDVDCNDCGAVREGAGHVYYYDCDQHCSECMELTRPEAVHALTHVPAVVATDCQTMGNIEHWYCTACGIVWADEALTIQTNMMSVRTGYGDHVYNYDCDQYCAVCQQLTNPEAAHDVVHVPAVEPTCQTPGNLEYWYCNICRIIWVDEALTQQSNYMNVQLGLGDHVYNYACDEICTVCGAVNEEAAHDLVHMEAIEPGCHDDGNVEYWYCTICNMVWADEALTQQTNMKSVVIPAVGGDVVRCEAIQPGCHDDGQIEHWYCEDCNKVWADEALTQLTNFKNVVLPAVGGDVVHAEAIQPGCHDEGQVEHWYCVNCDKVWADEALTQLTNHKNVIVPALGGDVVHMEAIAAGCHDEGQIEHWYCVNCDKVWADEALTQLTNHKNVIVPALDSEVEHIEALAATCHDEGNIEYWYCETCNKVWQDEALTQLTNFKNVITPALGGGEIVHVEAIQPGCHDEGCIEHWYCLGCDKVWQDEAQTQLTNHKNVILPAIGGDLVHVEAIEPGCHDEGIQEHWYCEECDKVWADEALTQLTNHKNVIIPAIGGDVVHMEAIAAGCHDEGQMEHWYCTKCDKVWADEALTQLTNHKNVIIPAIGGETVHMEAIQPGCHDEGQIEHWYCTKCDKVWADEALTQLTNHKNVIVPALGGDVVHVEALAATCHDEGNIEHWYCEACGKVWQDEALTQLTNHKNVITPALGGDVVHMEAIEPGCHDEGCIEHWICYGCNKVWQDEALTQLTNVKNVVLPAIGGETVHVEAIEPGCHDEGQIEHWYCEECGKVWQDEALTQLTNHKNVIVPAIGGELVHVEANAGNCKELGNVEHWYCEKCEKVWADEALTQLTNHKNVITGYGEHVYANAQDATCDICGEERVVETPVEPEKPVEPENPDKPGDTDDMGENVTPIVLAALIALISAAAVVLFAKKKA